MRKFALIIIALIVLDYSLQATTNPTEGEYLTVMANSGLTLRTNPSSKAAALDVIPFGEKVRVINSSEITSISERIEWVEGAWIYVEFEGEKGYVFDGFLSPFTVPQFGFEFSDEYMNLSHPLESWTDYHIQHTQDPDTIVNNFGHGKVIHSLEDSQKMIEENQEHFHSLTVYLSDIRIMDAYHLLLSMIESKVNRKEFESQSVFIEDFDGKIERIKINLDNPVSISQTPQGQIKVSVLTPNEGCRF